mgnify:FL=1
MNGLDFKKKLYKYWETSPEYYEIAHLLHADTEAKLKEFFTAVKKGDRVLDVACGGGVNRKNLPEDIFYCGIDLSFAGLSFAKQSNKGASFIKADAENLPIMNSSFDCIISTNAVEHFMEPRLIFDEILRVCKKDGCILLVFPNFGDYIFHYPPSLSHVMNRFTYRMMYIARQLYRQTVRLFVRRRLFFAKIDVVPNVLINSYSPDNDIVYLASGREVKSYFESLGASVAVKSKNKFSFATPFFRNIPKNIFRVYKAANPYYGWHGDSMLLIRK